MAKSSDQFKNGWIMMQTVDCRWSRPRLENICVTAGPVIRLLPSQLKALAVYWADMGRTTA